MPADPLADALLAVRLFALAPQQLGGIALRGAGPVRDLLIGELRGLLADKTIRRLPANVDDERLMGGVDIAASLTVGEAVRQRGLLEEAQGGVVIVPMAERLPDAVAGKIAQAMESGSFGLVLLDDGIVPDERPPQSLQERAGLAIDLAAIDTLDLPRVSDADAISLNAVASAGESQLQVIAATALALGVHSARALIFAHTAARAHAALQGRKRVTDDDLEAAARLVLSSRATQVPEMEPDSPPSEKARSPDASEAQDQQTSGPPPEDMVLEAALAAIPPDVLAWMANNKGRRDASGSGGGRKSLSRLRGKPLGARPGMPRGGARLALADTLRAAAPWQALRRRELAEPRDGVLVRKSDLRVRRFEERSASVTVFAVDASGSAAMARLAEAKGAVELLLAQAYVTRSEVALIAFRGKGAEVLLPPTRSLTRARRALAGLPGGGGTPLAAGLSAARQMGESIAGRGSTPFLVFLTDGSANVAADGSPGRPEARSDADKAARAIAASGLAAVVIDIAPRPRPDARDLAAAMAARYLPLPMADARTLSAAVDAARPKGIAA